MIKYIKARVLKPNLSGEDYLREGLFIGFWMGIIFMFVLTAILKL